MRENPDWRDTARTVKARIEHWVTAFAWYTMFLTANSLIDDATQRFMERHEYLVALLVVAILAAGFLIGRWVSKLIFSGLPDPEME